MRERIELKMKQVSMIFSYDASQPEVVGKSLERQQGREWTEHGHE